MNQISLLAALQLLDTRNDENNALRASTLSKLADTLAQDSARADIESSDQATAELKSQLRSLELETSGLADRLKQVSERLYSGRITNAKELADLNQDERMLQRRKTELEDRELALMEQIETRENQLHAKQSAFEKIAVETRTRDDKYHSALGELDSADQELARKRADLRAQLPAESLRLYDGLRATKKGRAVSVVKAASCSGCGTQVASGLLSRLHVSSDLVLCANCGRILAP